MHRRGWTADPRLITYEGTDDDFLADAIRHYVTHPGSRAAIGSAGELARLRAALPAPAPPIDRPAVDATPGGIVFRVAVIAGGLALSAAAPVPGWLQTFAQCVAAATAVSLAGRLHPLTWLRRSG